MDDRRQRPPVPARPPNLARRHTIGDSASSRRPQEQRNSLSSPTAARHDMGSTESAFGMDHRESAHPRVLSQAPIVSLEHSGDQHGGRGDLIVYETSSIHESGQAEVPTSMYLTRPSQPSDQLLFSAGSASSLRTPDSVFGVQLLTDVASSSPLHSPAHSPTSLTIPRALPAGIEAGLSDTISYNMQTSDLENVTTPPPPPPPPPPIIATTTTTAAAGFDGVEENEHSEREMRGASEPFTVAVLSGQLQRMLRNNAQGPPQASRDSSILQLRLAESYNMV